MPRPRTRTIASAAFGSAVARLKRPTTGYWPGTNTRALESAEPLPLASNVPVKQMPLAWLRRWPSAGPPGGASDATNLAGVSRCGESQPAVYAKTTATAPMTTAMIASRATGKVLVKRVTGAWKPLSVIRFWPEATIYVAQDPACVYTGRMPQTRCRSQPIVKNYTRSQ